MFGTPGELDNLVPSIGVRRLPVDRIGVDYRDDAGQVAGGAGPGD